MLNPASDAVLRCEIDELLVVREELGRRFGHQDVHLAFQSVLCDRIVGSYTLGQSENLASRISLERVLSGVKIITAAPGSRASMAFLSTASGCQSLRRSVRLKIQTGFRVDSVIVGEGLEGDVHVLVRPPDLVLKMFTDLRKLLAYPGSVSPTCPFDV